MDSTAAAIFRAVFDQSGIFAGIMDLRGYLREANNLSLEWCGYTREQVLDRPFWDTPWWRGSEDMKAKIRLATEQAAAGHVFREELRVWLTDGGERIVDFAMHPIRGRSGAVAFLHPTGIDITERKRVEAELGDSEQRLRNVAATRLSLSPVTTQLSAKTSMALSQAGIMVPSASLATPQRRRLVSRLRL